MTCASRCWSPGSCFPAWPPPPASGSPGPRSARLLRVTLDGIYDDGTFFTETYFDDGSIRYHDASGPISANGR